MPFAIELGFDQKMEASVRRLWGQLREAGLMDPNVDADRPHITLAVAETMNVQELPNLAEFAHSFSTLAVQLYSIGAFKGGIIFLAPIMTKELIEIHNAFHRRFVLREHAMSKLYAPGAWVPHCT